MDVEQTKHYVKVRWVQLTALWAATYHVTRIYLETPKEKRTEHEESVLENNRKTFRELQAGKIELLRLARKIGMDTKAL